MQRFPAVFWFMFAIGLLIGGVACGATEPATPTVPVAAPVETLPPTETATPQPTPAPQPTATRPPERNYTDGARNSAELQLYMPPDATGATPVLVIFHGSGVDKIDYRGMAAHFAGQGYAVVVADYRGRNMAEDALCVLGWVQANAATEPFDLSRVAVFGHSRGAIPATLAALVDDAGALLGADAGALMGADASALMGADASALMGACPHPAPDQIEVRAVATFGGVFGDVTVCGNNAACLRPYSGVLGVDSAELTAILDQVDGVPPHEWRQTSSLTDDQRAVLAQLPLYWLDGADPPLLIIHRERDVTVDLSVAQAFDASYTAAGAPSTMLILPGTSHNDPMNAQTDGFLEMARPLAEFLVEQMPGP